MTTPTNRKSTNHRSAADTRAVTNSHGPAAADLPESLEDIDAEIERIQAEEAAQAAVVRAHLAEEAAALAAAAEERDRPGIERRGRLAALFASKASTASKLEAAAVAAAHDGVESVKDDAFANAYGAKNAATFGNGTPDFGAVVATQLGSSLGVDIPPRVFTASPAGHVNGTFWGLDWFARVTLDRMSDVWTAEVTASTRNPDGSLRYMGDIASPLDLALLLAGTPRRSG